MANNTEKQLLELTGAKSADDALRTVTAALQAQDELFRTLEQKPETTGLQTEQLLQELQRRGVAAETISRITQDLFQQQAAGPPRPGEAPTAAAVRQEEALEAPAPIEESPLGGLLTDVMNKPVDIIEQLGLELRKRIKKKNGTTDTESDNRTAVGGR